MFICRFAKFLKQIINWIGYVGLFLLILASFSDRISPLVFPYVSYLGLFFPVVLVFNIFFLFFWNILKRTEIFLIGGIIFLICWKSIYAYFPFHWRNEKIPSDCIHIMTYNVMCFNHCKEHTSDHPNPILQYVIDRDPDIVCFQEFKVGGRLTFHVIKNALQATPYFYYLNSGNVALFSKYPILSARKIPFKSRFNGAFSVELDIDGRKVTLINCHLESNKISDHEKMDYYHLTKTLNTDQFKNVSQMIFHRLTPAFKLRAQQSMMIAESIKRSNSPYILVCGDLNDTPVSYTCRTIRGKLKDAFVESGYGSGITFHTHHFLLRIDYVFYSLNIKAYHTSVGKLSESDHYPVETYVQLMDNNQRVK